LGNDLQARPLQLSITLASLAFLLLRKLGLSSKHPYSVTLRGEPLWWTGPQAGIEEIGGFYTTRWVMASSDREAAEGAVRMVRNEVQRFARNPPGSPLCVEIEECLKLDGFLTWRGGGFAFWPKDEAQFDGWTSSAKPSGK
jgi:hypothetical protein